MLLRRIGAFALASLLIASQIVVAEETGVVDDPDFAEARAMLLAGRKDIIRDEIRLSETEAEVFWPAYDAYRDDVVAVRNRNVELMSNYLASYRNGTVSEAQAERFVDEFIAIKIDVLEVQKKHLRDFRRILPPRIVTRFYQLENKLDAELDVQLARFIPLIDPV